MHMEHNNSNSNVANPVIRDAEAHDCLPSPLSHEIACSAYPRSVSREESCRRRKDVGASESMKDKQPSMDDNGDKDQEKSGTSGLDPDLSGLEYVFIKVFHAVINSSNLLSSGDHNDHESIVLTRSGVVVNSGYSRQASHWSLPPLAQ